MDEMKHYNHTNNKKYIQHGRGPSKRHKYIKIINGKYIYPKDLIKKGKKTITDIKDDLNIARPDAKKITNFGNKVYNKSTDAVNKVGTEITKRVRRSTDSAYARQRVYEKIPKNKKQLKRFGKKMANKTIDYGKYLKKDAIKEYNTYKKNKAKKIGPVRAIVKRAEYESQIRQKNGGYPVPKGPIVKRAERIKKINQKNGYSLKKKSKQKRPIDNLTEYAKYRVKVNQKNGNGTGTEKSLRQRKDAFINNHTSRGKRLRRESKQVMDNVVYSTISKNNKKNRKKR